MPRKRKAPPPPVYADDQEAVDKLMSESTAPYILLCIQTLYKPRDGMDVQEGEVYEAIKKIPRSAFGGPLYKIKGGETYPAYRFTVLRGSKKEEKEKEKEKEKAAKKKKLEESKSNETIAKEGEGKEELPKRKVTVADAMADDEVAMDKLMRESKAPVIIKCVKPAPQGDTVNVGEVFEAKVLMHPDVGPIFDFTRDGKCCMYAKFEVLRGFDPFTGRNVLYKPESANLAEKEEYDPELHQFIRPHFWVRKDGVTAETADEKINRWKEDSDNVRSRRMRDSMQSEQYHNQKLKMMEAMNSPGFGGEGLFEMFENLHGLER